MNTNRNILGWTGMFTIAFVICLFIFQPDNVELYQFSLIGMSWLIFMTACFSSVIAFTNIPYIKAMLQGGDNEYSSLERRWSLLLIGAVIIGTAIFMGLVVPNIIINAMPQETIQQAIESLPL